MTYDFIEDNKEAFEVQLMCDVLQISPGSYYAARNRPPSERAQRTERIKQDVQQVFEQYHGIYGHVKIAKEMLEREDLETACRNTIAKYMRELNLKSCVAQSFKPCTTEADPSKIPAPNVLAQNFQAERPNQKWVADITYIPTESGWVYLAVVLDLFSRKIVGWAMSDSLEASLVTDALKMAIRERQPEAGLIHHSDRGSQYTSHECQQILSGLNITCSMSRKGNCYDNSVCERFFWSLKKEWVNRLVYADLTHAQESIFYYIESFYNHIRRHEALGLISPVQFEAEVPA